MRKSKSTIEIDFAGVQSGTGGFHIPAGSYPMVVESAEFATSVNRNEMIRWTFKGTDGKAKGKRFPFYTLTEESLGKLRQTLEALGLEVPDGEMEIDLDELEGAECYGAVEDDTYQGQIRSQLVYLFKEEEEEEDDEKPVERKKRRAA